MLLKYSMKKMKVRAECLGLKFLGLTPRRLNMLRIYSDTDQQPLATLAQQKCRVESKLVFPNLWLQDFKFNKLLRMGFILSKQNKNTNTEPETEDSATDVPKEVIEYCENGLKKLQGDKNCHSLLKKHLSEDVLNELKTKKTSVFNSNLKDVIQSGVENLDSGIGVYAPDAEAYVVFALLFDPIIEEYHGGFSADQQHPPNDLGDPSIFGDLDPENK